MPEVAQETSGSRERLATPRVAAAMPQHVPPLDIRRTANVILTYPPPPPGALPQAHHHHHPHHSPSPVYPPPQQPPMPSYAWPVVPPPPPSQRPPSQQPPPPPSADGSYVVGSPPRPSHLASPQLFSATSVSSAPAARPAPGLPQAAPLPGQPIAGQAYYATAPPPQMAGAAPAPKPVAANSQPAPGHYMEAYCPRCQRKMQRQMRKLQQVGVHCIPHYQYGMTELEVIDLFYDMYVRRNPSESWDVNRVGCTHGGGGVGDARRAMSEATSTSAATSQGDFISLSHASSDSTAYTEPKVAGEVSNRPDAPPPGINAGLDEKD
eukprot:Rhum_TRINITY_DN14408_c28_g1::Rhum_TRINITY_DN14408_c28_g1_i1::g.88687::m.88687